jgi:hypothetical protein
MRLLVLLRACSVASLAVLAACADVDDKSAGGAVSDGLESEDPDEDNDGFPASEDCNDGDAAVNPGATEACNGLDDDCDGVVDNGVLSTWYADGDGDGFGDPAAPTEACAAPDGAVANADDCDDADGAIAPGAAERCNGVDDDCDAEIDEDVRTVWYADADEDGHGDPETTTEDCDPPEGWLETADDCDDADPTSHPGAEEVCDEADNDCDTEVDEGVRTTYYADVDGDGYGVLDTTTLDCEQPPGFASEAGDCDDGDSAVHPSATEVCNGIDDDCDGAADDDDPSVDTTTGSVWYTDGDSDGYGLLSAPVAACLQPAGTVVDATDCDDGAAAVNPGATEVCNTVDDDCDGDIDDADSSLDLGSATSFYDDDDGDGYGDLADVELACAAPSGTVTDATDCDDGDSAVNPGATEVCNTIDDDCDGDVDDDDATVDLSTGSTWYDDSDGDGYGDAAASTLACAAPSSTVSDATDCDDSDSAVSPAATEVCNTIDDDCDGDIDDADSSLDLSTADTWYRDSDGDGEGDLATTALACDQPSGYVDNSDDCDDLDATDTDGDGEQDCADDDIDGDDLRNDWDADPYDDSIVRGPTGGLGTDGPLSLSSTAVSSEWALLDGGATSGGLSIDVDDGSVFSAGDEVLVLSQQGSDAGQHQLVYVSAVSGDTLSIEPPLDATYSASSTVLVQRVPHYTTASISGTLSAEDWTGSGGGVVIFRATGAVTVTGSITASGAGFSGGRSVSGNSYNPTQGESHGGAGAAGVASANDGGGGAYPKRGDNGDSGGGGGYGSAGSAGTNYGGSSVCSGGSSYGDVALADWFLGSGGGGGSPDTESDGSSTSNVTGAGGAGGGLVAIFSSDSLTVTGSVVADGDDGANARANAGEVGGGGAGSGGQILLVAPSLSLGGTITALGGGGGRSAWHGGAPYGSAYGGDGGDGRIRLEYTSFSGSTNPSAGSTGAYAD